MKKYSDAPRNLLLILEIDVLKLSPREAYDRSRLLSKAYVPPYLKEMGYSPNPHVSMQSPIKRFTGAPRVYKSWVQD